MEVTTEKSGLNPSVLNLTKRPLNAHGSVDLSHIAEKFWPYAAIMESRKTKIFVT